MPFSRQSTDSPPPSLASLSVPVASVAGFRPSPSVADLTSSLTPPARGLPRVRSPLGGRWTPDRRDRRDRDHHPGVLERSGKNGEDPWSTQMLVNPSIHQSLSSNELGKQYERASNGQFGDPSVRQWKSTHFRVARGPVPMSAIEHSPLEA